MTIETLPQTPEDRELELHMELWSVDRFARGGGEECIQELHAWMQCGSACKSYVRGVTTPLPTDRETLMAVEDGLVAACRKWARSFDRKGFAERVAREMEANRVT